MAIKDKKNYLGNKFLTQMTTKQTTKKVQGLGLCSGGLDSILSAILLQNQGIEVTWICFETPFFSSIAAQKASEQTGIPLITLDITKEYMKMMESPKAGFGKNMNPCMDCHSLMFHMAGKVLEQKNFDFLFSGEVVGQRPKSQNKNSLRYVEKNSGFDGLILRPLSARLLPPTIVERNGLIDREKLLDISGRSRKIQMQMAKDYGIKEYPSPAGGCLLTDKIFSKRLKDLLKDWRENKKNIEKNDLYLLRHGRHFRLDSKTKVIVGRSEKDNNDLLKYYNRDKDILIKPSAIAGPDVILTGGASQTSIKTAAMICAGYTRSKPGKEITIQVTKQQNRTILCVKTIKSSEFRHMMI